MRDRDGEGPLGTAGRREYPSRPAPGIAPPDSRAGLLRVHPGSVVLGRAAGRASGKAPRLARIPGYRGSSMVRRGTTRRVRRGGGRAAGTTAGACRHRGRAVGWRPASEVCACAGACGADPPCGHARPRDNSRRCRPWWRYRRSAPARDARPRENSRRCRPWWRYRRSAPARESGNARGHLRPRSGRRRPRSGNRVGCRRGQLLIGWAAPDMRSCQPHRPVIESPGGRHGGGQSVARSRSPGRPANAPPTQFA